MKCHKCGFVSFDYLSECRKCGADLTAIRQQLGFSAARAEVPFLLGSLLKDEGRTEINRGKPVVKAEDADFAEDFGLDFSELSLPDKVSDQVTPLSDVEMKAQNSAQDGLFIELLEDDLEDLPEIDEMKVPDKGRK